jgi:hypothetical protein
MFICASVSNAAETSPKRISESSDDEFNHDESKSERPPANCDGEDFCKTKSKNKNQLHNAPLSKVSSGSNLKNPYSRATGRKVVGIVMIPTGVVGGLTFGLMWALYNPCPQGTSFGLISGGTLVAGSIVGGISLIRSANDERRLWQKWEDNNNAGSTGDDDESSVTPAKSDAQLAYSLSVSPTVTAKRSVGVGLTLQVPF